MKKKILYLALSLMLIVCFAFVMTSCGECTSHVDPDEDGICNNCGAEVTASGCSEHEDGDKDGYCDNCEEPMSGGRCYHENDIDGDQICDDCGHDMTKKQEMKPLWTEAEIVMRLNKCSNDSELSSQLERYLAGAGGQGDYVDQQVSQRNIAATKDTKVKVDYRYWDDDSAVNAWSMTIEHISDGVTSGSSKNVADVYSSYIYDLVGASVKGLFANLKGTSRGTGKLKGLNYFEFVYDKHNFEKEYNATKDSADVDDIQDRGFMYDWMESVTLDPQNRMYVLASDYYIDMVRAFFMIPVNKSMLEDVANKYPALTGERDQKDKDKGVTLDDFYAQVKDGEWTYQLMMDYAAAAHQDDGDGNTTKWLGDNYVGFAMSDSGVATSGIIYTTNIEVIKKTWNASKNDYDYYYPETADQFGQLATAIKNLLAAPGIVLVHAPSTTAGEWNDISDYNNSDDYLAIRNRFGAGNVLFGDIMMVGALEESEYQNMGKGAFGVLPVPIYHNNDGPVKDRYLTQIHNVGRPGAIAFNTKKFVECTAFLNYQSTQSSQILEDYYIFHLCSKIAGGGKGTVEMLDYLRNNVRTSFDKAMEDAMGVFNDASKYYKMTYMLNGSESNTPAGYVDYNVSDITTKYAQWHPAKTGYLNDLLQYFKAAKD